MSRKWYSAALEACLDAASGISDVSFLRVFASPLCLPPNDNYGLPKSKRKSGPKKDADRRSAADIRDEQCFLLEEADDCVKTWVPEDVTVKDRLKTLGEEFLREEKVIPDTEYAYSNKNSNYKSAAYIHYFLHAPDAEEGFRKVAAYYGNVLEKVFGSQSQALTAGLAAMKKLFEASGGDLPSAGEEENGYAQMGTYLCGLLILAAVEECASPETDKLKESLFGIVPDSELTGTRSVFPLKSVTLEGAQFLAMCKVVLEAEPELPVLEMIYDVLSAIRKKADGQLNGETLRLVRSFMEALESYGERTRESLKEKGWRGDPKIEAQISRAGQLIDKCQLWLPEQKESQATSSRT